MNIIGFKNFRRFRDFKPVEIGNITFLVGRNNSGKSTVVKALLLLYDYLKSENIYHFSFGNKVLEDANIVTYNRALNRFAKDKENFIQIKHRLDNFIIEIRITAEGEKTEADVLSIRIGDINTKYIFKILPQSDNIEFKKLKEKSDLKPDILINLEEEILQMEAELKSLNSKKSSREYIEAVDKLQGLKVKRNSFVHEKSDKEDRGKHTTDYNLSLGFEETMLKLSDKKDIASVLSYFWEGARKSFLTKKGKAEKISEPLRAFDNERGQIMSFITKFTESIFQSAIYYLGANNSKQSALFAIRDKNNALAQAIHDFVQLGIDKDSGSAAFKFLKKWMKNDGGFEIGEAFEITPRAGEAYEVLIESNGTKIPLADKGMGSIQAMLLLFRIACIMHKTEKIKYNPLVVIEEPELNLHPALQSKLADLFLEVHENNGINFIVETHSEYLIRKTQLLVKDKEFEVAPNENPFTILYFDKDNLSCWKMNYREDGKFTNDFGKGFYDESANLTINLL